MLLKNVSLVTILNCSDKEDYQKYLDEGYLLVRLGFEGSYMDVTSYIQNIFNNIEISETSFIFKTEKDFGKYQMFLFMKEDPYQKLKKYCLKEKLKK